MTSVFVSNSTNLSSDVFSRLLNLLPAAMQADVMRYLQVNDRNARLLARIMLYNCMREAGCAALINEWQLDNHKKPYVNGFGHFNISHAGDLVVLAVSTHCVGVDVEKEVDIDIDILMGNFSPAEKMFIHAHENKQHAFYQLWVKKEALLKAIGTGLADNLAEYDCSGLFSTVAGTVWHFHHLPMPIEGYSSCLCSANHISPLTPVYIQPDMMAGSLW